MSPPQTEHSLAVPCHRCGYDVHVHPHDGVCPECEASVAESRRMALIPVRPAWGESDPRWRRRMLAGVWMLALVPLLAIVKSSGWARQVPVPTFFAVQAGQTLNESFLNYGYEYVLFCMGLALLFSNERHRQRARLDWTRRWGVVASYGVTVLGFIQLAIVPALVILGLAALCQSMPRGYQPRVTDLFVAVGTRYVRYGPHPSRLSEAALVACSAITVLLACVPLFDALRSSAPRRGSAVDIVGGTTVWATILLAPLAIAAMLQVAYAVLYAVDLASFKPGEIYLRPFYFYPRSLTENYPTNGLLTLTRDFLSEAAKWLACLVIAMWLSLAQIAAMVRRRHSTLQA